MTEKLCIQCNAPLILKPAGVARVSGKPYDSFWACSSGQRHVQSKAEINNKPDGFAIIGETLSRIELKLDFIIDDIQNRRQAKPMEQSLGMQSIKEILEVKDTVLPEDEIVTKDIPF